MFPLYFNIMRSGHNLHATLVLSTSLFFFTKPRCCHMLAFTFLFGTIFKRLAPIYHVCYTATALSANSRRGGSTESLNCHFECGEEPGDEFCQKKLGEVYFSICACKIVPRQTRSNRRGIYSIKENAKGDHLKTINNYGNCRNYYRLLNLQSMYCYRNTYNPDALIVQCIVTPLKYSSTNFKQRHSREKCFWFIPSQK